jgi:hypothetical protein
MDLINAYDAKSAMKIYTKDMEKLKKTVSKEPIELFQTRIIKAAILMANH